MKFGLRFPLIAGKIWKSFEMELYFELYLLPLRNECHSKKEFVNTLIFLAELLLFIIWLWICLYFNRLLFLHHIYMRNCDYSGGGWSLPRYAALGIFISFGETLHKPCIGIFCCFRWYCFGEFGCKVSKRCSNTRG